MPNIAGLGVDSSLQLAKETTYGTAPAAATAKYELLSASINPVLSVLEDPSMTNTQISRRSIVPGGQYIQGTFKVRANMVGMEELYRALLAAYTSSGSPAVTHTFKESPSLNSYTIELSMGNIPTSKVNRITGCFFTGMRVASTAGTGDAGFVTMEFDVIGAALTTNQTPMTAATIAAAQPCYFGIENQSVLVEGSGGVAANCNVRSFNLNVVIPYNPNRYILGSVNALRPIRSGPLDVTWTFEEEWTDVLLLAAVRGTTAPTVPLLIQFQEPTAFNASNKRTLTFQSRNVVGSEFSAPIDGPEVIYQTASYRCAYSGTDSSALVITTLSDQAALV